MEGWCYKSCQTVGKRRQESGVTGRSGCSKVSEGALEAKPGGARGGGRIQPTGCYETKRSRAVAQMAATIKIPDTQIIAWIELGAVGGRIGMR